MSANIREIYITQTREVPFFFWLEKANHSACLSGWELQSMPREEFVTAESHWSMYGYPKQYGFSYFVYLCTLLLFHQM